MDHCTLWLEGWWAQCCKAHDAGYTGLVDRSIADWELLLCVATSGPWWAFPASVLVAVCMFLAVRAFGWYFYSK